MIDELESSGFPVNTAFWLYFPDSDDWRLLIASPYVEQYGPLEGYHRIQQTLAAMDPPVQLHLDDISARSPRDNLVAPLAGRMALAPPEGVRLRHSYINGTYYEDAYVYRAEPAANGARGARTASRPRR
ncbi:MAG TPA: hypothetical protein VFA70_07665 [Dehalococcoidia bacterium]|nr:hypothetical protein [Dehalococcoidia bacterium]